MTSSKIAPKITRHSCVACDLVIANTWSSTSNMYQACEITLHLTILKVKIAVHVRFVTVNSWTVTYDLFDLDNMKRPATILVLPVFYQNLPVSAILVQILVNTSIPASSSICNTRKYWSLPKYEYCRYRKILGNTGYTSIAQYCRYWKILENTGYTSIADTGRLATKLQNVLVYCCFFSCLCVCYERTDSV